MVVDKVVTFLIMYSLTATPAQGLQQRRNPNDLMANSTLGSKLVLGNTLEEQVNENYAASVVESETSKGVKYAKEAFSKPDGKYAELASEEFITLKMAKPFNVRNLGDIAGRIECMEGEYSLAVPVRTDITDINAVNAQGQDKFAWIYCIPSAEGGFRLPNAPQAIIDQIKITNIGTGKLKIDAVIGYGN